MKKCFTVNPFRNTSDFESFYRLFELGIYQGVEIFYPFLLTETDREIYFKNSLRFLDYNAEMVLHLPHGRLNDLCNLATYKEVMERLKTSIDFGKKLNVKKYTLHLGYINGQHRHDLIDNICATLVELCDYAEDALIMIENMPGGGELGYCPKEIKNIILRVNKPNLKFILDTGHANVSEFEIYDYIKELHPFLSHIHLSDNKGIRDEHGPLGTGTIPFKEVFKALKKYQGLYCLEVLFNNANDLIEYSKVLDTYFID